MTAKNDINTLFTFAIDAEELVKKFYRGLRTKFKDSPEVSKFWNEMVEEEREHGKKLKDIHDSLTKDELQSPADPYILKKMKEVLRWSVMDLLDSVETLSDACDRAYDLEYSEVNHVFKLLTTKYLPDEEEKNLERLQTNHLKKLLYFRANVRTPEKKE